MTLAFASAKSGAPAPFQDLRLYHYGAILADPPWRFRTYNEKGRNRCPDWKRFKNSSAKHYETMSIDEIAALPVAKVATADCVLFLWATWPMLPQALNLIVDWGFLYKTLAFDWMKAHPGAAPQMGLGYWTRSCSEICLLATRGKPARLHADVRAGIIEPRREHSRKPDCVHARIERLVAGPYLELFARRPRAGWTVWGDQI
jgi:N6-adenosine-specific RNA methylase IME4